MCGIVGAIAQRDVAQILLAGLKRLEYRGYDSAGMAIINPATYQIQRLRAKGKVARLEDMLNANLLQGTLGIAHTRWATHGEPNTQNAHPHFSNDNIAVVHNGIIENHALLREQLQEKGYTFTSDTDSEVIAHLIHHERQTADDVAQGIRRAIQKLEGAYALGIIANEQQGTLYAARAGSPLVIGIGIGEHFIASDPLALLPVTQEFIYLEDGDIAVITTDTVCIQDLNDQPVTRDTHTSEASADSASKGSYRHFMQKEIFEQPDVVADALQGHFIHGRVVEQAFGHQSTTLFPTIKRIQIAACGTSYHAALLGKYWLESIAGLPVSVDVASEFRYRDTITEPDTLFIALSQSGETADTLAALKKAKAEQYAATLAICNVPESSLVREADTYFMTRAGTEIGVAATKTFTNQLIALALLTLVLGRHHGLTAHHEQQLVAQLLELPALIKETLALDADIKKLSHRFRNKTQALFLGRGFAFPIALEGALKLKEISYIHAEAYPAGELKHGPLALVENGMPIIVNALNDTLIEKLQSNLHEVQARGGDVIVFTDSAIDWPSTNGLTLIKVPAANPFIAPLLHTIPVQLLAYHVALRKGTDVDQPRNLAKSVTVE